MKTNRIRWDNKAGAAPNQSPLYPQTTVTSEQEQVLRRGALGDDLEKKVAHLTVDEIRKLTKELENDGSLLKDFLQKYDASLAQNKFTKRIKAVAPGGWKCLRVQYGEIYIKEIRQLAKLMGWRLTEFLHFAISQTHHQPLREYCNENPRRPLMLTQLSPSALKKLSERCTLVNLLAARMCNCSRN